MENRNPAIDHQQTAMKALAEAMKQLETAMRALEAIHPVAANSTEYKDIKAIGTKLKESMVGVMKMRIS